MGITHRNRWRLDPVGDAVVNARQHRGHQQIRVGIGTGYPVFNSQGLGITARQTK